MARETKITLDLWHDFTLDELREKGLDLAAATGRKDDIEIIEKAHREEYKKQWEEVEGSIRMISSQIRRRGILRAVNCIVQFHKPHVGAKQVFREDTGELVKEEAMTPAECQEHLFPPEPEQAKSAAAE